MLDTKLRALGFLSLAQLFTRILPFPCLEKNNVAGLCTTVGKADFLLKLRMIANVALMRFNGKRFTIKLQCLIPLGEPIGLLR